MRPRADDGRWSGPDHLAGDSRVDHHADAVSQTRAGQVMEAFCSLVGHRWTPWERPLRLVETCRCNRCGRTRERRLGLV